MDGKLTILLIVALGLPLSVVGLTEASRSLRAISNPFAGVLAQIQNFVLPTFAVYLVITALGGIDPHIGETGETPVPVESLAARCVLTAASILALVALLSAVNAWLQVLRQRNAGLDRTPGLLIDLVRLTLVLIGVALIISVIWNVDLQGALVGLGVGGIVLGLALQDTLSALFAGLSMVSSRTFKEGDWLSTGDHEGKVIGMDWRSVTIETDTHRKVVIPNSELAQSAFFIDGANGAAFAEEISVKFAYGAPPEQVIALMLETAVATEGVAADLPPDAELLNLCDDGAEYEITLFVHDRATAWTVHSNFLRRLWYAADRAGLALGGASNRMYRAAPASHDGDDILSILLKLSVFDPQSDGLKDLASAARIQRYGRKETVRAIGDAFASLQLPVEGGLSVTSPSGELLQTLVPGDVFVARNFLTAGKCPAEIVSRDSCTVLELPQGAVLSFLDRNPREATRMERLIEQIQNRLDGEEAASLRQPISDKT